MPAERVASRPSGPTPFQQFIQQIENAVAEASGETFEEDEPIAVSPTPARRPSPLPAPPPLPAPEFHAVDGSFDALNPVDHVRHGFGLDNPLSEERFEQQPPQAERSSHGPLPDPHGLQRASRSAPPIPGTGHWRQKLRDPKAAREAFVLQTIFGPRGGRRSDPR